MIIFTLVSECPFFVPKKAVGGRDGKSDDIGAQKMPFKKISAAGEREINQKINRRVDQSHHHEFGKLLGGRIFCKHLMRTRFAVEFRGNRLKLFHKFFILYIFPSSSSCIFSKSSLFLNS